MPGRGKFQGRERDLLAVEWLYQYKMHAKRLNLPEARHVLRQPEVGHLTPMFR